MENKLTVDHEFPIFGLSRDESAEFHAILRKTIGDVTDSEFSRFIELNGKMAMALAEGIP